MTAPQYDAIIIGSGHNSLACACVLQSRGWSVLVLERAEVPGGAVKTGEYTQPGFRHDWAAMNLSLFAGSAFHREHAEALAAQGLEFSPAEHCFASVFPDGRWLGIGTDREANTARIKAFSDADAAAWSDLSDNFPDRAEEIFAVLGSSFSKKEVARIAWRLLRGEGVAGAQDLGRFLASSSRAWLDETFTSAQVKATLGAWGMHLDFAPDIAGGAMFPYLESMANQAFGMVIGKGGADTMTRAMQGLIESKGGALRCGQEVTRILHERGTATGVELADGSTLVAKKAVIANVAPRALSRLTGGTGDRTYEAGLARFSHAPGTMMIHLALDALPDWRASGELQSYAYVHIAPSLDQMARTYQQATAGMLPDEPVIVVGQPTVVDPTRAPEGKHTLWLQVRMVPGQIAGDAKGEISAIDWDDAAAPMADRVLDIVETHAPRLRGQILGQNIVTPAALEADNPNLVGGDQICGSHHASQHFIYRPMRGRSDGSTPIRKLWHTGAAVWPGAGTGAGPGYMLGKKLAGK